jgi:indole-3-glycerol phosphate synthase
MTTAVPDLLAAIVAGARRITEVRRTQVREAALERAVSDRGADGTAFVRALRESPAPRVIAECKRRSPSRGILRADYDPARHACAYADAGAAAISVLTEPSFFDGALEHLAAVRDAVSVPLLRKDFIVSRYQILEAAAAGASAVWLIVAALSDHELRDLLSDVREIGLAALVEIHTSEELGRALDAGADIVGVNSRDLRTLAVHPHLHDEIAAQLPAGLPAVAESGLRDAADLRRLQQAGYRAFLVGERLIMQDDPGAALRAMRGAPV